ncbi:MAG TPA: alpha/beta fold hydrolase [Acidimicrobiales bacterium]|nr:alpha/beta fold hydrolase [Acidimicrobiales bacterium]
MATFVLVHGACHGPWCWEPLTPLLTERGHAVVAPELPCDDPSAGLMTYVKVVEGAIDPSADDLVLVGHSLGGLTVPAVASRRDVRAVVFLAGIVGMPGKSLADLAEIDADRDAPLKDGDIEMQENGTFIFSEQCARRALYHDCAPDVADAAIAQLRPQRSLWADVSPDAVWPQTRFASIVSAHDRIVNPDWSQRIARERLGCEPIMMESGHSPMLSHPETLADILLRLAP